MTDDNERTEVMISYLFNPQHSLGYHAIFGGFPMPTVLARFLSARFPRFDYGSFADAQGQS